MQAIQPVKVLATVWADVCRLVRFLMAAFVVKTAKFFVTDGAGVGLLYRPLVSFSMAREIPSVYESLFATIAFVHLDSLKSRMKMNCEEWFSLYIGGTET